MFELAVLELKEVETVEQQRLLDKALLQERWRKAFSSAAQHLDKAVSLTTNTIDMSSRLDTRISLLRDEISAKMDLLGINPSST